MFMQPKKKKKRKFGERARRRARYSLVSALAMTAITAIVLAAWYEDRQTSLNNPEYADLAWSGDGTTLTFKQISAGREDYFALNTKSKALTSIDPSELNPIPTQPESDVILSPDGTREIVIERLGGLGWDLDIRSVGAPGTQNVFAGSFIAESVAWSPDSRWIAWITPASALWVAQSASEQTFSTINPNPPIVVNTFDHIEGFVWSPDNQQIAFVNQVNPPEIWIWHFDTVRFQRLHSGIRGFRAVSNNLLQGLAVPISAGTTLGLWVMTVAMLTANHSASDRKRKNPATPQLYLHPLRNK
jgi:hypothetical protein